MPMTEAAIDVNPFAIFVVLLRPQSSGLGSGVFFL